MDDFWHDVVDEYTGPPLTDDMVRVAEKIIGRKLPESYLRLLRIRNGGYPRRDCFPTSQPNSWAEDHIQIQTVFGVGFDLGIDGPRGFKLRDRGCPDLGIVIADTPSGGHDFILLDYRACGPHGEPKVAHVETEGGVSAPVVIAPDFETFARGLVDSARYDLADDEDEPGVEAPRRSWWRFWK
ncbi:MAG: SMI1/KNR4 family protein [Gemmataceae bacterium]|nr:SMI1/KNR4 family protein [Gemmataceae bacterium]MCI0742465.1 SMI1/KNR4 family protein [Gemmataceae bacterium]